jgi:hypothetical protein
MIRAGSSWCDLVKHADGRVELVHQRGTVLFFERVDVIASGFMSVDVGRPLLYLRAASSADGRVCVIGQGHDDGNAWVVIEDGERFNLGSTHGVFPVLIFGDSLGWVAIIQRTVDTYDTVRIKKNGGFVKLLTHAMPPTSQGFLFISSSGEPVTQDRGRGSIPGLALPSPATSDPRVWAGQSMTAATLALFDADSADESDGIIPLNTPGGQPPHIVESGGTYYVCSYVDGGAWLSMHRRPFAAVTPPPVDPPITPPVNPPPEETPVQLESKHSALIKTFAARFPPPGHDEDALRDHWTPKLIEQFVFSFPGEGWCWKSTSPGGRPSSDVIARQVNGGMWGYDLILSAGRPNWSLATNAGPIDLRSQAAIPMRAVNHLGATTPPVTPPTQPPVTPPPSSGRPFPNFRVPEDVFLHAYSTYIGGLYARDRIVEPGGTFVCSRGATMWFVPIFYEQIIGLISRKGNTLPTADEWWRLADEGSRAAIDFYRRTAPPE